MNFIILMTLSIGTLGYNEIQMILSIGTSGVKYRRYTNEYIMKLQIHQHSILTRKVFSRHNLSAQFFFIVSFGSSSSYLQVIFIFKSSSSSMDHHWIIIKSVSSLDHHLIWIITGSSSSLDHH